MKGQVKGTIKIDNPILGKVESSGGPLPYITVIGILLLLGFIAYLKWGHPKIKQRRRARRG